MALVVITGGARCGKSAIAEQLALTRIQTGMRVCAALFRGSDENLEFAEQIRDHRDNRPAEFRTFEASADKDWLEHIRDDEVLLVDSLGTMLSACMAQAEDAASLEDRIDAPTSGGGAGRFRSLVQQIAAREGDTIVVTSEVGLGMVPEYESGRQFRDLLSRANRDLIQAADAAYLCIAGRLVDLDKLPRQARWPQD